MRLSIYFAGLVLLFAVVISCNTPSSAGFTTLGGYNYEVVSEGSGEEVDTTDFVSFVCNIYGDEGTVLFESGVDDSRNMMQMPPAGATLTAMDYMVEAMLGRNVGDSIVLRIPADTLRKSTELDPAISEVLYCIKIRSATEKEAFQLEMAEEKRIQEETAAYLQAKEPEIKEKVADFVDAYNNGSLKDQIVEHESGLKYVLHEEGTVDAAKPGDIVSVHYYGVLEDGSMFDNSWKAGSPYAFPLDRGQAIKGWDIGIGLFPKGSKATIIVPYPLAYGEAGRAPRIPEKATLIFYIEIEE